MNCTPLDVSLSRYIYIYIYIDPLLTFCLCILICAWVFNHVYYIYIYTYPCITIPLCVCVSRYKYVDVCSTYIFLSMTVTSSVFLIEIHFYIRMFPLVIGNDVTWCNMLHFYCCGKSRACFECIPLMFHMPRNKNQQQQTINFIILLH